VNCRSFRVAHLNPMPHAGPARARPGHTHGHEDRPEDAGSDQRCSRDRQEAPDIGRSLVVKRKAGAPQEAPCLRRRSSSSASPYSRVS
jgi:hypothetical protein